MIGRRYPWAWSGNTATFDYILSRPTFSPARAHPELMRRVFALADAAFADGLTLGPGGGWRPLSQQMGLAPSYHNEGPRSGEAPSAAYLTACATRGKHPARGCCWYDGHPWIHRVDGVYARSIHKAMPPSWHMGVAPPGSDVSTFKDLDQYPCAAVDLVGSAVQVRRNGTSWVGDHCRAFGLHWAGKNDAPHVQILEMRGVVDPITHRRNPSSAGRTELIPWAGWPPTAWPCPEPFNNPYDAPLEADDMAQLLTLPDDPAAFEGNGSTVRHIIDPVQKNWLTEHGLLSKTKTVIPRADLRRLHLVGPDPVTNAPGVSTVTGAEFASWNPAG